MSDYSKNISQYIDNKFKTKETNTTTKWIINLWKWADENNIPDTKWIEDGECDDGIYFIGLARDEEELLKTRKEIKNRLSKKVLPPIEGFYEVRLKIL